MSSKNTKKELTTADKAVLAEKAEQYTDGLVKKAHQAALQFEGYTQVQVDKIVAAMALAASEHSLELAHEAHNETGRGIVEDKDTKNRFASESVYNSIKNDKTVGVISENKVAGSVEIAALWVCLQELYQLPTLLLQQFSNHF